MHSKTSVNFTLGFVLHSKVLKWRTGIPLARNLHGLAVVGAAWWVKTWKYPAKVSNMPNL